GRERSAAGLEAVLGARIGAVLDQCEGKNARSQDEGQVLDHGILLSSFRARTALLSTGRRSGLQNLIVPPSPPPPASGSWFPLPPAAAVGAAATGGALAFEHDRAALPAPACSGPLIVFARPAIGVGDARGCHGVFRSIALIAARVCVEGSRERCCNQCND